MRAAPGTVGVDRGWTKVARVEAGEHQGGGPGVGQLRAVDQGEPHPRLTQAHAAQGGVTLGPEAG
jgi:hypothetical protein